LTCLVAVALLFLVAGCATKPKSPQDQAITRDAPGEVAAEFRKSTVGWNSGDLDAFLAIYAENATLAQPEGYIVGKTMIRLLYQPRFAPDFKRDHLVMERLDVEEIAPDIALVRGIYRLDRDGTKVSRGTTTLFMKKIEGNWRILHDHST
jgi:uncharacterized protein (TIGR02246 family)